jgi:uncharacterized membrane protein
MTHDPHDAEWRDPRNWRARIFYVAPRDPRLWVPKRPPGIGWTLNFSRPASWLVLALILGVPLVVALVPALSRRAR